MAESLVKVDIKTSISANATCLNVARNKLIPLPTSTRKHGTRNELTKVPIFSIKQECSCGLSGVAKPKTRGPKRK
jgi:hypothetical protein